MIRHLATGLVFVAITAVSSLAAAEVYETVDAIETNGPDVIVTGIVAGQDAPSTKNYNLGNFGDTDVAGARCERFALLAMSKPGKFQLTLVPHEFARFTCKLTLRTP